MHRLHVPLHRPYYRPEIKREFEAVKGDCGLLETIVINERVCSKPEDVSYQHYCLEHCPRYQECQHHSL